MEKPNPVVLDEESIQFQEGRTCGLGQASRPADNELALLELDVGNLLHRLRKIDRIQDKPPCSGFTKPGDFVVLLQRTASDLLNDGRDREAGAVQTAINQCLEDAFHGGLGISKDAPFTKELREAVAFQLEVWLESLNSEDRSRKPLSPLPLRPAGRRPMTLSQKILAHHAISSIAPEALATGDLVRVAVDWVITSELAWAVSELGKWNSPTQRLSSAVDVVCGDHKSRCSKNISKRSPLDCW